MRTYQKEMTKPNVSTEHPRSEPASFNDISSIIPFELTTENCIYVHGGLMASLFIFALARALGFYSICVRASQKLHDLSFNGLISTTMRFFDTNPGGRILNRFSKDIGEFLPKVILDANQNLKHFQLSGSTDEFLPKAILDATQVILSMVGSIIVTSIVNPIFLIPIGVMGVIFIFVRKVFLKTSKNIKRLEGSGKLTPH